MYDGIFVEMVKKHFKNLGKCWLPVQEAIFRRNVAQNNGICLTAWNVFAGKNENTAYQHFLFACSPAEPQSSVCSVADVRTGGR